MRTPVTMENARAAGYLARRLWRPALYTVRTRRRRLMPAGVTGSLSRSRRRRGRPGTRGRRRAGR